MIFCRNTFLSCPNFTQRSKICQMTQLPHCLQTNEVFGCKFEDFELLFELLTSVSCLTSLADSSSMQE